MDSLSVNNQFRGTIFHEFLSKENRHWFEIAADGFLAQWRDCFRGVASSRDCEFQTLISPGRQCWESKPRRLDNRVDFVAQCRWCDWPQCSWPSREDRHKFIGLSLVPGQRSHASCRPGSARRSGQGRATTDPYGGDNQRRCVPLHARTKSRQRRRCKFDLDGTEVASFPSHHSASDTACIPAGAFLARKLSATVIRSAYSTHTLIYHRR